MRDGWVMLWDERRGLSRVRYLSPHYQLECPASHACAAVEIGPNIRVAFYDISRLTWFDIKSEDIYDRISMLWYLVNI